MFKLIIEDDEGHTTVVPLVKEEITIGRKDGNTIRLTERNVSRHHARLIRSNGSVFIEDLDSYNGVKVNGGKISARTTIREGDLVEIGDYHLALQKVDEPQHPPSDGGSQPPPIKHSDEVQAKPEILAPTTGDGGTAVLRLPVSEKQAAEPSRARQLDESQAGRLIIVSTDLGGQVFNLSRTEMTIGRTEENDISLPHRSVSSRHAKIVYDGGVYRVIDLDSANGVLVNGEEYARVDIRKGDVIELGHVKLRYVAPGEDVDVVLSQVSAEPAALLESTPVSAAPQPSAAAPMGRTMVDASFEEARATKGGSGKLIGLIVGGVAVLGLAAFGIMHFTSKDKVVDPGGDEKPPVVAPDKQPEQPPDTQKPAATAKTEAADYYMQGLERMKGSDWDLAEKAFASASRLDPDHKGALEMLERVRKEKEGVSLLKDARAAIERKDWDEALDLLNQIGEGIQASKDSEAIKLEVIKKYRGFHLNKADRYEKNGKLEEALKELDSVLMVDEDNYLAKSKKEKIEKRLANKRPQDVAQVTKKPPTTTKKPPAATGVKKAKAADLRKQGINAHKQNKFAEAIKFYQQSLKANAKDHDLHRLIGTAYAQMGKRKAAYQSYRKYVQLCPKCMYAPAIRKILSDYEELQE